MMRETLSSYFKKIQRTSNILSSFQLDVYSSGAAFFIFISMIPFMIVLVSLLPYFPFTQNDITNIANTVLPYELSSMIINPINEIYSHSKAILPVSVIVSIWTASRGIMAMSKGLNKINYIDETRNYFVYRFTSMLYTILLIIGVVVMIILGVFGKRIFHIISEYYPEIKHHVSLIYNYSDTILIILLFFMFLFFYVALPSGHSPIKSQMPGALLAATVWWIFTKIFSYYILNFNAYSMYGSIATVVIFLVWIYAGMYFMFIGAWFNYRLSLR